MKNPHRASEGVNHSKQAVKDSVANRCPDAPLCQRWHATDGGLYCRYCWRDYTTPKPIHITEGRV